MTNNQKRRLESSIPGTVREKSDWLLTTKLNPPLIRSDIVDRPQLLVQLEQDIGRPLTLITAPAGYGKSTLAAQWLHTSSLPGVWISLDEGDNDTRIFLSYVVAAVRRLESNACVRIHDLLDAPLLPPSDILAKLLVNSLEEISQPFLLVIDDYHLVTDQDVNDLLIRLLQHPPRSLHLVIVTRRDPPFPLVTMKSRGLAVEIREADLQFDVADTGQVLERVGDIHLDEDGLARVMDEIEGWITGLRLFCLAVEKGEDPKVYLFGMSGGANHVQDYLVEQVLSHQTPEMKDWLLKSSLLDRFCASLCEAVCNDSPGKKDGKRAMNGRKFMETVTEEKLFGIQLEAGGEWNRYHHLFQALLCSHLQRKWSPNDIATLHRRAAQWFGDQGLIEEGLKHAQAAGDSELAADIIEDARLEMMKIDKWHRLGKWLDSLPSTIENSRPHLLMSRAYVLLHSIRVEEIPALLEKVVALEGESPLDPMLAGELDFFRGVITLFMGEVESSQQHLKAALRTVPATNLECSATSEMYSCVVLHLNGQGDQGVQTLQAAIQRNEPRSPFYHARLVFGLSFIHAVAGHWPGSFGAAERLVNFARTNDLVFAIAWGAYMQGNASLQMLDLEETERSFSQVFEMRYILNPRATTDGLVGLALCRQIQGREAEADHCLQQVRKFAHWTGNPAYLDFVDSGVARVDLLRGNGDSAARWLAAFHGKPDVPVKIFFLEYPEITACRVLIAKGTQESLAQAATEFERLEEESRRFHHDCQLVPVLVMKSVLAFKQNRLEDALSILAEAVSLAWPGRWILPFIEGGAPVAELLAQLPENPEWGSFVPQTLARFAPAVQPRSVQPVANQTEEALIEGLTNRETDVLTLVCERLYDKEIADRLGIATATVKTHLTRVYGKLGVSNRREAARKAKRLNLV